jgi:hypothetical protein
MQQKQIVMVCENLLPQNKLFRAMINNKRITRN